VKSNTLLISLLIFAISCIPLYAKNFDVSSGESIQTAINDAVSGDIIKVGPGEFNEDIVIRKGISLEGAGSGKTSLIGFNLIPCVTMKSDTSIKGFYIKASPPAYNILVEGTNTTIESNHINAKYTAIRVENGSSNIKDNRIDSVAFTAIDFYSSNGMIENNLIQSVYIGINVEDSIVGISRNTITGNGNNDHGILITDSEATIRNNVIYNNRFVGISAHTNSDITIVNNTIYNNAEQGILCYQSSPVIMNNIMMNNRYGIFITENSSPKISYNNLYNNSEGNYMGENSTPFTPDPGDGEISEDPIFTDVQVGNFELSTGSKCIDAGNPASEYNDPDGSKNDIGAYGGPDTGWIGVYDLPKITISTNGTLFSRDSTLTITVTTTNNNPDPSDVKKFIVFASPAAGLLFYPSWTTEIDYKEMNLPSRYYLSEVLFSATLKDPLPNGDFTFYAGLANENFEFPAGISSTSFKIANKPNASFTVTPKSGKVFDTIFYVDASQSSDTETPKALLQFCWRWEDGWGFSNWSTKKKAQHRYPAEPGTKTITLQVRDLDGFIDTTTQQVEVKE